MATRLLISSGFGPLQDCINTISNPKLHIHVYTATRMANSAFTDKDTITGASLLRQSCCGIPLLDAYLQVLVYPFILR